jgi:hypothetical protein
MFTSAFDDPDFTEAFAQIGVGVQVQIQLMLEAVGAEVIAYLRSLTAEMRPPTRPGEGERSAHPGHWADVTGNLSNAYGWRVESTGDGYTLVLFNTMDYAVYLEAKEGFFVLRGITDNDGPVEQAIRNAAARIAPEWRVVNFSWQAF